MKVHLMNPTSDFAPEAKEPQFAADTAQDLELDYLWDAMAGGDEFLREVSRAALLQTVDDAEVIVFRQQALADCTRHPEVITKLYAIAGDALELQRGFFMLPVRNHPKLELSRAVKLLTGFADQLDRLRALCSSSESSFSSPAFQNFFAMSADELDDDYMLRLRRTLRELRFPDGLLMSAGVGPSGNVTGQVLRRGKQENRRLFNRTPLRRPLFAFTLAERDEAGANALSELRNRSVNDVANAASQSADHVLAFFTTLRAELGFYLACGNLSAALAQIAAPACTPDPATTDSTVTTGLYDPCLALRTGVAPVGNDVDLQTSGLLVITGANQGGKTTLLRALGTAQLMMQAGMPVPAEKFAAMPVGQIFTHWAREEDAGLTRGKLDEELDRMGRIVAKIQPGDLLLCNESFASTNAAEGSQIVMDVTAALVHADVQVRSVTHLYDFAQGVAQDESLRAVFLRAERADTGQPNFRLILGPPLPTSYGLDLYDRQFGTNYADAAVPGSLPAPDGERSGTRVSK